MGVFARLLGRSKSTAEASTADEQSVAVTDESAPEETEAANGTAETDSGAEAGIAEAGITPEKTEAVAVPATEGVEIPKQQSAEEAADSEAGEGARK